MTPWFTCRNLPQPIMIRGAELDPWAKQRRTLHGHPEHVESCAECRDLTNIQAAWVDPEATVQIYPAK